MRWITTQAIGLVAMLFVFRSFAEVGAPLWKIALLAALSALAKRYAEEVAPAFGRVFMDALFGERADRGQ